MPDLIEAFVSVITFLVAVMILAVLAGADTGVVTTLFSEVVEILVGLFVVAVIAAVILGLVSN